MKPKIANNIVEETDVQRDPAEDDYPCRQRGAEPGRREDRGVHMGCAGGARGCKDVVLASRNINPP